MIRALVTVALLAISLPASAGNQNLYGFGTRGPAMSGAVVAFAQGFEAIYYNPAGITIGGRRAFTLGFQATGFDLQVKSPRPEALEGLTREEPISGVVLGFNVSLPLLGVLKDRISLGVGFYIPTNTLLSARIPEPYAPQFGLIGDAARALSIQAALGIRIMDWLRIGGSVRVLAGLTGFIDVAPNELGVVTSRVEDELVARYGGSVGIIGTPHPDVKLGLVWRSELGGAFDLPITAKLGANIPIEIPPLRVAGTAAWDPMQVALHIGWEALPGFRIETGLTWKDWTTFPTPVENATTALPPQEPIEFSHTFVPRLGLEYSASPADGWNLVGRLGYAFEPSPVGEQTGQHNFLDGDRHISSAGFGFGWGTPSFRFDLDLYGALHVMTPRTFVKSLFEGEAVVVSDNAGYPWIGVQGLIWSTGVSVEVQL